MAEQTMNRKLIELKTHLVSSLLSASYCEAECQNYSYNKLK
jgi:hypothetical protein